MINKKGQGMSTNTIILLILGLVVLIALIWGFASGWQGVKTLINPSNVDDVVRDCSAACTINSEYSYCFGDRTLRVTEDDVEVKSSCLVFATAGEFDKYGISDCPQIDCKKVCGDYKVNEIEGKSSDQGLYNIGSYVGNDCVFPTA